MGALVYGLPLLFLASAPLGFLLGGGWSFLTLLIVPLSLCGFDWALGSNKRAPSKPDGLAHRLLPRLYVCLQVAVTVWAVFAVGRPGTTAAQGTGLTLSVGLTAGIFGILAAHELVHRPQASERGLALTMLAAVGYMHFRIAHIHGHHARAATLADPASARRGESAYRFILRSVLGQFSEAWAFERARLHRRDRPVLHPANRMLHYLAVELAILAAAAALGPRALAFWIGQAVLAVVLLELFNYIAHYGLERRAGPGGGLERLAARHSWNSSRRMNNWSLFNMGRHTDHHRRPTAAYQALEIEPQAPELPTGYAGAILMSLAPPVWRRVMDPRVNHWMKGEADPCAAEPTDA